MHKVKLHLLALTLLGHDCNISSMLPRLLLLNRSINKELTSRPRIFTNYIQRINYPNNNIRLFSTHFNNSHRAYETFGITKKTILSKSDLTKIFSLLCKSYHPDKNPKHTAKANKKMAEIIEAYKAIQKIHSFTTKNQLTEKEILEIRCKILHEYKKWLQNPEHNEYHYRSHYNKKNSQYSSSNSNNNYEHYYEYNYYEIDIANCIIGSLIGTMLIKAYDWNTKNKKNNEVKKRKMNQEKAFNALLTGDIKILKQLKRQGANLPLNFHYNTDNTKLKDLVINNHTEAVEYILNNWQIPAYEWSNIFKACIETNNLKLLKFSLEKSITNYRDWKYPKNRKIGKYEYPFGKYEYEKKWIIDYAIRKNNILALECIVEFYKNNNYKK